MVFLREKAPLLRKSKSTVTLACGENNTEKNGLSSHIIPVRYLRKFILNLYETKKGVKMKLLTCDCTDIRNTTVMT